MNTKPCQKMPRVAQPNARFWVWRNDGWVKLTLKAGQSLSWGKNERTDEGHSWESDRWAHVGAGVLNEWANGGSDCDGPISRAGASSCRLGDLQTNTPPAAQLEASDYHEAKAILRPDWRKVGEVEVCDVFAQAAGY